MTNRPNSAVVLYDSYQICIHDKHTKISSSAIWLMLVSQSPRSMCKCCFIQHTLFRKHFLWLAYIRQLDNINWLLNKLLEIIQLAVCKYSCMCNGRHTFKPGTIRFDFYMLTLISSFVFYHVGIEIQCKGKCHVSWKTRFGKHKKIHSASETYFNEILQLYGK